MSALLLALGASLAWGVADFVGPLVSRTLGTLRVLFWAQVGGVLGLAAVLGVRAQGPARSTSGGRRRSSARRRCS